MGGEAKRGGMPRGGTAPFLNRDPIEEAGGINLYGFCGNDGVNCFDVNGNSWFSNFLGDIGHAISKLWDNTGLALSRKIAQDWDDGGRTVVEGIGLTAIGGVGLALFVLDPASRPYIEIAVAIAASVVTYGYVAPWAAGAIGSTFGVAATSTYAAIGGGIVGGAAAGFVSGTALGEMSGQGFIQALDDGLEGAEFGSIEGGIAAGEGILNANSGLLRLQPLSGNVMNDLRDVAVIGGRGLEGALANTLEDKNASLGFWSGAISGVGGLFNVPNSIPTTPVGWETLAMDDLAKGFLGGLGSMNKHGQGFMTGFWSAEAITGSTFFDNYLKADNAGGDGLENDAMDVAARGLLSGAAARFGFKTFSSGLFIGAASEFLQDIVPNLNNPERPLSLSGAVTAGFNLLQPRVTKKGVTYPLTDISGGPWGRGASWAQLFAPQASASSGP